MADTTSQLVFKLIVDGKEAIATLDVLNGQFIQTGATASQGNQQIEQSYNDLIVEVNKYNSVTTESTGALASYIASQNISVNVVQQTIRALEMESSELGLNTAEWKQKKVAAANLKASLDTLITQQKNMNNATVVGTGAQRMMNMATMDMGHIFLDGSMMMQNFRMGMIGVSARLTAFVDLLTAAKLQAGENVTTMKLLTSSLMSPTGGLIIGLNMLMFALNVLPALFENTSEKTKKAANYVDDFTKEHQSLETQLSKDIYKVENLSLSELNDTYDAAIEKLGDLARARDNAFKQISTNGLTPEATKFLESILKTQPNLTEEQKKLLDTIVNPTDNLAKNMKAIVGGGDIKMMQVLGMSDKELGDAKRRLEDFSKTAPKYFMSALKIGQEQFQLTGLEAKKFSNEIDKVLKYDSNKPKKGTNASVSTYAAELKDSERLQGEEEKLKILQNDKISAYEKEKQAAEATHSSEIKGIEAQIAELEKQKKFKNPIDEKENNQKIINLKQDLANANAKFEIDETARDKKHKEDLLSAEYDYAEKKMQLENKTEVEILEKKQEYYLELAKIENDPEKLADYERKIYLLQYEIDKKKIDNALSLSKTIADLESDEFAQKRKLADIEYEDDKKKYGNLESLRKKHSKAIEKIDKDEANFKLDVYEKAMGNLAGIFGKQTAAYKALAIAQSMIETYKAATAALSPPPIGAGPLLGPILAATTVAAGIANVAQIAATDVSMPGYAKGGIVVGEKGPEIITPMQDYASGQTQLILSTLQMVKSEIRNGTAYGLESSSSSLSSSEVRELRAEVKGLRDDFRNGAIKANAYLDDREAKKIYNSGSRQNRRGRV